MQQLFDETGACSAEVSWNVNVSREYLFIGLQKKDEAVSAAVGQTLRYARECQSVSYLHRTLGEERSNPSRHLVDQYTKPPVLKKSTAS